MLGLDGELLHMRAHECVGENGPMNGGAAHEHAGVSENLPVNYVGDAVQHVTAVREPGRPQCEVFSLGSGSSPALAAPAMEFVTQRANVAGSIFCVPANIHDLCYLSESATTEMIGGQEGNPRDANLCVNRDMVVPIGNVSVNTAESLCMVDAVNENVSVSLVRDGAHGVTGVKHPGSSQHEVLSLGCGSSATLLAPAIEFGTQSANVAGSGIPIPLAVPAKDNNGAGHSTNAGGGMMVIEQPSMTFELCGRTTNMNAESCGVSVCSRHGNVASDEKPQPVRAEERDVVGNVGSMWSKGDGNDSTLEAQEPVGGEESPGADVDVHGRTGGVTDETQIQQKSVGLDGDVEGIEAVEEELLGEHAAQNTPGKADVAKGRALEKLEVGMGAVQMRMKYSHCDGDIAHHVIGNGMQGDAWHGDSVEQVHDVQAEVVSTTSTLFADQGDQNRPGKADVAKGRALEKREVGIGATQTRMEYLSCDGGIAHHSTGHGMQGHALHGDSVEQVHDAVVEAVSTTVEQFVHNANVPKPVGECTVPNTQCFHSDDGLEQSEVVWFGEASMEYVRSDGRVAQHTSEHGSQGDSREIDGLEEAHDEVAGIRSVTVSAVVEQRVGNGNVENGVLECGFDSITGVVSDDAAEGPMLDSDVESPVNANEQTVDDGVSNGLWNEVVECVFGVMGNEQVKAGHGSIPPDSVHECEMDVVFDDTTVVEESGVNGTVCEADMHIIDADGGGYVAKPIGECTVANTQCLKSDDGLEQSEVAWAGEASMEYVPSD